MTEDLSKIKQPPKETMSLLCAYCECPLPLGCGHFYGEEKSCQIGPRTDMKWRIGLAIWYDLSERKGIKQELYECDVETMGRLAMEEMARGE